MIPRSCNTRHIRIQLDCETDAVANGPKRAHKAQKNLHTPLGSLCDLAQCRLELVSLMRSEIDRPRQRDTELET